MNYRRWLRLRAQSAQDVAREIDDELATHLELRIEELIRQGESRERARQRALERFGDWSGARRELTAEAWARRQRGRRGEWLEGARQDFSHALRRMRSSPGHTLFSLTTFALAIGLTTATFSLVDGVLLRSLPFRSADRIVTLLSVDSAGSAFPLVSAGNFADWKEQNTTLAAAALHRTTRVTASFGATAERVTATEALGDFFAVLQTPIRTGRSFDSSEAQAEAGVVVVSEAFWRQHLGADPMLGASVRLDGRPYSVIGVIQAGFEYPTGTDVWVPARYRAFTGAARNNINFMGIARLRDGATAEQADRDLDRIARHIRESDPAGIYSYGVDLTPLKDIMVGGVARYLGILLGAVAFVLLIACANLAGVNLARGAARARELAVRASLGATRGRLVRQLLVEQTTVALVGGAAGVLLAWWAVRTVIVWLGALLPRAQEVTVDARILAFALLIAITAGVLSGIAPAWLLSRAGLRERMGGRSVVRGGRNLPGALLVASEVGVALVLLASAGLLIRSYQLLLRRDLGFDPDRVVTAEVTLPVNQYRDTANILQYWDRILTGLRATPGITAAGLANWVPLGSGGRTFIEVEGRVGRQPGAGFRSISNDYFRSLGIRLHQGRDFESRDDIAARPVAIINRRMAELLWPGQTPLGLRLRAPSMEPRFDGGAVAWRTVVGVVEDIRHDGFEQPPDAELYVPFRQAPLHIYSMTVTVRTRDDPNRVVPIVREHIHRADPRTAADAGTLRDRLDDSLRTRRLVMSVLTGFGALALALVALGFYSLLAFAVSQRTREMAVRAALGAPRFNLIRLVVGNALLIATAGTLAGLAAAAGATRVLSALLVEVQPFDAPTFMIVAAGLLLVAALAALVPARRAARLDPLVALRAD